jgi:hypothetical protein
LFNCFHGFEAAFLKAAFFLGLTAGSDLYVYQLISKSLFRSFMGPASAEAFS